MVMGKDGDSDDEDCSNENEIGKRFWETSALSRVDWWLVWRIDELSDRGPLNIRIIVIPLFVRSLDEGCCYECVTKGLVPRRGSFGDEYFFGSRISRTNYRLIRDAYKLDIESIYSLAFLQVGYRMDYFSFAQF